MKKQLRTVANAILMTLLMVTGIGTIIQPITSIASGGSGGGSQFDSVKISKCYTNATTGSGGQMLVKASSSDPTARLFAYRPDGILIGEVQNGGGSRYGGTVMPYQPYDPVYVTIKSTTGGTSTVPTTAFQI